MQDYPHIYSVTASAETEGEVTVSAPGHPTLSTAPPKQFGGPGDLWSPETLLAAAVADCFILSFRATARASKLAWHSLECHVDGTLDRVERVTQFTELTVRASLRIPPEVDQDRAERLLERAEKSCLITQSLKATSRLETKVELHP